LRKRANRSKKHRALKTDKIEDDIAVKTRFKPIIGLLQKIVDSMRAIKDESELPDDVKTLSVQKREENAKWGKRKQSNNSLDRKSKRLDASGLDASPITSTSSATSVQCPSHSQTRMFLKPRTTRSQYPFKIRSKSVANARGSKNVARTLGSAELKVRQSYFDR